MAGAGAAPFAGGEVSPFAESFGRCASGPVAEAGEPFGATVAVGAGLAELPFWGLAAWDGGAAAFSGVGSIGLRLAAVSLGLTFDLGCSGRPPTASGI